MSNSYPPPLEPVAKKILEIQIPKEYSADPCL